MKIQFTEDFANKIKGEVWEDCDDALASYLINQDKVAVKIEDVEAEVIQTPKPKTSKK